MPGLMKTQIKSLPFLHRGKVRDIYAVGDDKLLVVQTDRLSASEQGPYSDCYVEFLVQKIRSSDAQSHDGYRS